LNTPLLICTSLIERTHNIMYDVRSQDTGAPEYKSVVKTAGIGESSNGHNSWLSMSFANPSQALIRISWAVVVSPPQLRFWRRLLKENLG